MTSTSPRPNHTSIVAACILSGGLITAAIIDSHRPVALPAALTTMTVGSAAAPPIAQDSAQQQFEAQMTSQTVESLRPSQILNHPEYGFKGVKVKEVAYSSQDDTFKFTFTAQWQGKTDSSPTGLFDKTEATATNDGYGHYRGTANVGGLLSDDNRNVDFTIR